MSLLFDLMSWGLLMGGSFFCLTGALGLIRLPDFLSRVHGAGVLDSMGTGLIMLGLIFQGGLSVTTLKIVLVMAFLLITGPTAIHALARAALSSGIRLEDVAQRINPQETATPGASRKNGNSRRTKSSKLS